MRYTEEQLRNLNYIKKRDLQKQAVAEKDIEALLSIAIHLFIHGSDATNEYNLPEIAYYFGRKHDIISFYSLLKENQLALITLSRDVIESAKTFFDIGTRFPYLSSSDMEYLDKLYSDGKTCDFMERIMFDEELLPRPLKKFNRDILNIRHDVFSEELLDAVFECFAKNEEIGGYEPMFMYYRPENRIIRKRYQDKGLGDFVILFSNSGETIYKYTSYAFGHERAISFMEELYPRPFFHSASEFANSTFFCIPLDSVTNHAEEYFHNQGDTLKLKRTIAKLFLEKCNRHNFKN